MSSRSEAGKELLPRALSEGQVRSSRNVVRLGVLLLLVLLGCETRREAPARTEQRDPEYRVRYGPARILENGRWGRLPGELLPGSHPERVSGNELLFFRQADGLYILDGARIARVAAKDPPLRVLERLDRDHVLVVTDSLGVLELSTGKLARLPGNLDSLVSLTQDKLFLRVNGVLQDLKGRLSDRKFNLILDEDDSAFYALSGNAVYRVQKSGGETLLGACPMSPDAWVSLSLDHTRVAVGEDSVLRVYELKSGRMVRELKNIDARLRRMAQRPPRVVCGWLDEHTVRFSTSELTSERDPEFYGDRGEETPEGYFRWHDLDLRTGQELDRGRYARLGVRPSVPSALVENPVRVFWLDELATWLPKAEIQSAAISHDGKQAALILRQGAKLSLTLLREDEQPEPVAEGPSFQHLTWLPAVGKVDWCPPVETGVGADNQCFDRVVRFFPKR